MTCSECGVEAFVMGTRSESRDGRCLRVLSFRCQNRRCRAFGRTVGELEREVTERMAPDGK